MKRTMMCSILALALAMPAVAQDVDPKSADVEVKVDATTTDRDRDTSRVRSGETTMTDADDSNFYTMSEKTDFYASTLIGSRIYATTADVNIDSEMTEVNKDWDDIGEVNNLIIGRDGEVKAVVLGVGGFLGIGEKDVAVEMDALKFVKKAGDAADDYFIVINSNKETLEKAPAFKRNLAD